MRESPYYDLLMDLDSVETFLDYLRRASSVINLEIKGSVDAMIDVLISHKDVKSIKSIEWYYELVLFQCIILQHSS